MFSTPVVFTVPPDVPEVSPPFREGTRDEVWVLTSSDNERIIREAAVMKLDLCYGITLKPEELTVYAGFEY
jgi:hypothetical protein